MAEPLFTREADGELPEHLQGKTPREVAQYYQGRETTIRAEAAANNPPPANGGMTAGQQNTMISGAKLVASQGKEHWTRFLPEIEGIMSRMDITKQTEATMWDAVYNQVLALHFSELRSEAVTAATAPPPSMESSSPITTPEVPRQLTEREMRVVDGLNRAGATAVRDGASVPFDAQAYLDGAKKAAEGAWPLTFKNY